MTLFFTADLHLGHANINRLAGRPFASVEEADAELVKRWNERVAPSDDVLVLGDVCMGRLVDSLALTTKLNGTKHLVPGNHDRVSALYKGSVEKKREWRDLYLMAGFHILDPWLEWPLHTDPHDDSKLIMVEVCHFPYEGDSHGEDRYVNARPVDEGRWLIHGHVHEAWKLRGRQVNVGVDVWDYAPVSEQELVELIRANS